MVTLDGFVPNREKQVPSDLKVLGMTRERRPAMQAKRPTPPEGHGEVWFTDPEA